MASTESTSEVIEEKPQKAKRVLSAAQLENLKLARVKAAEKRKELGDITSREKAAKESKLQERIKNLNKLETEAAASKSKQSKSKPKPKRKSKHALMSSSDSSSSSESSESSEESSEEEEVKPSRRKQQQPKPVARLQKIATKKPTSELQNEVIKEELRKRIQRDSYARAFHCIFPDLPNEYL